MMPRFVHFRKMKPRFRPKAGEDIGVDSIAERLEKDLDYEYKRRDAGSIPV